MSAATSTTAGRRRAAPLRNAFGGTGVAWLMVPPVLFLVGLVLVPLGILVAKASQDDGFSRALEDQVFRGSVPRTLLLAACVAAFAVLVGTVYALALALASKRFAVLLATALGLLFFTSLLVRTYGWLLLYLPEGPIYKLLHALGLRDEPVAVFQTDLAAYPAMVHVMLPFVILPVYGAILQIDPMQIRASRVLGARPATTLWRVILPQLRAGIAAGGILVFIMSLGFYVTPQLLGNPLRQTVAGVIGGQFNLPGQEAAAAAMSVLLIAVVVFGYLLADRLLGVSKHWERR